jgi:hypothetical protein
MDAVHTNSTAIQVWSQGPSQRAPGARHPLHGHDIDKDDIIRLLKNLPIEDLGENKGKFFRTYEHYSRLNDDQKIRMQQFFDKLSTTVQNRVLGTARELKVVKGVDSGPSTSRAPPTYFNDRCRSPHMYKDSTLQSLWTRARAKARHETTVAANLGPPSASTPSSLTSAEALSYEDNPLFLQALGIAVRDGSQLAREKANDYLVNWIMRADDSKRRRVAPTGLPPTGAASSNQLGAFVTCNGASVLQQSPVRSLNMTDTDNEEPPVFNENHYQFYDDISSNDA